jgi:2-haloacid dehalogenase/putative hydrolase of the HAD superfamily
VPAEAPPRAVLFDVGNVIVRWDPRTLYSKIFPDPAERERFLAEICTPAWRLEHDRGRPIADGVALLISQYPEYAEAIDVWRMRWWEMFSGTIPETTRAIEDLHGRGVPLFGLTNMSAETSEGTLAMHPAFNLMSDIVISGKEGVIKPDPRIFEIACQRAGFPANELLFIDDSPTHIAAAEGLGFRTHHFVDPAALRPALEAQGLL